MRNIYRVAFFCILYVTTAFHTYAQLSFKLGIDTTQSLGNFDYVFDLIEMDNGNFWMAGRCERTLTSSGGQVSDYGTVLQLTPAGNILTSQKSGYRSVNTMIKSSDGNLVLGGEGSGFFCTSGLCKSDMLVSKVTTNYVVQWGRSFGNPNYNGSDGLKKVIETADSNIVVVGNIYESSLNSHPFIAKLNGATGDTIWTRAIAYPANQFGNDASEGPNGEIFIGISGDLRVVKMNTSGNVQWSEGFANYGQVINVFAQADGSVIAAGHHLNSSGDYCICLFKISGGGTLEWFYDYHTPLPDHNEFINDVIYSNGYFYFAGYHYSSLNFTGYQPLLFQADSLGTLNWGVVHPTAVGEMKTLLATGNTILCGMDYNDGAVNNRPDILVTEMTTSGITSNNCFQSHTLLMSSGLPTMLNAFTGYYSDFETQPTAIAFSYQNYWDQPACVFTGGSATITTNTFSLIHENEIMFIEPAGQEEFNIQLTDVAGRVLFTKTGATGRQQLPVGNTFGQVIIITCGNGQQAATFRTLAGIH